MNCANCLETEDDRHSFVCEECQADSIDSATEGLRTALGELANAVRAYIKAKDLDRVAEFVSMKRAEKKARTTLMARSSQPSSVDKSK